MSALDVLGDHDRALVTRILERRDPELLSALARTSHPDQELRRRITDTLGDEFLETVGPPDYEPTDYGRRVDAVIGAFFLLFPQKG